MYLLISSISIALLVYVALKASLTSFTHDESFTYLNYVHEPFLDIISYKRAYTNNHILNTVLIKYTETVFGNSELALRLPNVLACLLYVIYSFKMVRRIAPALMLSCFICLVFNTHFIDFFGLARGYGLSFAFMMMSVYHLIKSFGSSSQKHLILFNAGAFFAVLSNFSLLNYYISALMVYNIVKVIGIKLNPDPGKEKPGFYKLNRIHLIAIVLFVAVLYEPIRRISKQGMLDFGGKTGFVEDTFGSLIRSVFYETPVTLPVYYTMQALLIGMLVLIGLLIIKHLYIKDTHFFDKNKGLMIVYFILTGIIILCYAQHIIIHNDFYTGRFGLFFYPLVMLNFVFYTNYLYENKQGLFAGGLSAVIAVLLIINFSANMNLWFYQDWKYDSGTKTAVHIIQKETAGNTKKIKPGVNWLFEPTFNFYRYTYNLTWLIKADRKGIKPGDDYYYIFSSDTNAYLAVGKPVLFLSETINTMLVKNKSKE